MKEKALPGCSIQLVAVPSEIWQAIHYVNVIVTVISLGLACSRMCYYPNSYSTYDQFGKREILRYHLSYGYYKDLDGLSLLPITGGTLQVLIPTLVYRECTSVLLNVLAPSFPTFTTCWWTYQMMKTFRISSGGCNTAAN